MVKRRAYRGRIHRCKSAQSENFVLPHSSERTEERTKKLQLAHGYNSLMASNISKNSLIQ